MQRLTRYILNMIWLLMMLLLILTTSYAAETCPGESKCSDGRVCCIENGKSACCDLQISAQVLFASDIYYNSTWGTSHRKCDESNCPKLYSTCCGDICCKTPDADCCPKEKCCKRGQHCCPYGCCPENHECCDKGCCSEGSICCPNSKHCCAKGNICCGENCCSRAMGGECCGGKCCYAGSTCCANKCCISQKQCCGGKCCPLGLQCCGGMQCCGVDEQCCLGGWCCKNTEQCSSLPDKKCSSAGTILRPVSFVILLLAYAFTLRAMSIE